MLYTVRSATTVHHARQLTEDDVKEIDNWDQDHTPSDCPCTQVLSGLQVGQDEEEKGETEPPAHAADPPVPA